MQFPVSIAEPIFVLAFDTIVNALTFYKTYRMTRLARSAGVYSSLSEIILRDGELTYSLWINDHSSSENRPVIFQASGGHPCLVCHIVDNSLHSCVEALTIAVVCVNFVCNYVSSSDQTVEPRR